MAFSTAAIWKVGLSTTPSLWNSLLADLPQIAHNYFSTTFPSALSPSIFIDLFLQPNTQHRRIAPVLTWLWTHLFPFSLRTRRHTFLQLLQAIEINPIPNILLFILTSFHIFSYFFYLFLLIIFHEVCLLDILLNLNDLQNNSSYRLVIRQNCFNEWAVTEIVLVIGVGLEVSPVLVDEMSFGRSYILWVRDATRLSTYSKYSRGGIHHGQQSKWEGLKLIG